MRSITNPLKEGLPSKIYLTAFSKPISRYGIAKILYSTPQGQVPPTAKVSNVVKDLLLKGYLEEIKGEGVYSKIEPLIIEIEKELQKENIILTKEEKVELSAFLGGSFRYLLVPITPNGDMNAYTQITNTLGTIVISKLGCELIKTMPQRKILNEFVTTASTSDNNVKKSMDVINEFPSNIAKKLIHYIPEGYKFALILLNLGKNLKTH